MKLSRFKIAAFVTISAIASNVQALSPEKPVPVDQAGRPVIDASGHRIKYSTPAVKVKSSTPTVLSPKTENIAAPSAVASTNPNLLTTQWVARIFGVGIGAAGLMPIDINNDGIKELVFASNIANQDFGPDNSYSVLSYQKLRKSWAISRQNMLPQNYSITASATYRYNTAYGNNHAVLAFAVSDNSGSTISLQIHDLTANKAIKSISLNIGWNSSVKELLIGDGDNDGQNELIAVTENATYLYNLSDFKASGSLTYGAAHAALGNVDNDADNELVYSNGKVVSFRNTQATLKWSYPLGFGNFVRLANIDTDAPKEIIGASGWYYVRALDADIHSVKWEHYANLDIDALQIADINKDGKTDIVFGEIQWGTLHALDNNGNEFWTLSCPEDGATNIAVFDADADGDQDIIWGTGYSHTGPDYLHIYDVASKKKLFQSDAIDPSFSTVTFGDADNDGQQEFITVTRSSQSGYGGSIIQVLNADTGLKKWQSNSSFLGLESIFAAVVGDVNRDGKNELVLGGRASYYGGIYLVDAKNHSLQKTISITTSNAISSVNIADIDGDGYKDIIATGISESSGTPGTYVYVIDGTTGTVKWRSHNLGEKPVYDLDISDLNGDGKLDILVSGDYLFAFDGVTHVNWMSTANNYTGISIKAIPNSTAHNIVAGNSAGELRILKSDLNTTLATYPVCKTGIGAVEMLTYNKILFTCNDQLKLFDLATKSTIWSSSKIATGSTTDALAVKWVNGILKVGLGASLSRLMRYNP